MIAGALTVMFELHRRGSARTAPADLGLSTCIDFHRKSLERQRDALRTVWIWYLLPFVPGLAIFEIGSAINQWEANISATIKQGGTNLICDSLRLLTS